MAKVQFTSREPLFHILFALLTAQPEWGKYFALGQHVIVVLEGQAYEVTEGNYELALTPVAGPVLSPVEGPTEPSPTVQASEPTPTVRPPESTPIVHSAESTPTALRQAQDTVAPASAEGQGKPICPGAALSAVLPLLALAFAWRRR